MRVTLLLLALLAAVQPAAAAVESVDDTLGTGEVMAFGLNTYLVYLELSELGADFPSWILGAAGITAGSLTLILKDYDGTLFGDFLTGVAAADLLLGGWILRQSRLRVAPLLRPVAGELAPGLILNLRF